MSFSFRNIFTPDGELVDGAATDAADGNGVRGCNDAPAGSTGNFQSYLVGELIAFIPKAIVAQSGIPMEKEVRIPVPADGSGDVKLSVIFQHCPELFAAEITPLNDATMTLPPKIGAMNPSMAASTGFHSPLAETAKPSSADNPFWTGPTKDSAFTSAPEVPKAATEMPGFGLPSSPGAATKTEGASFSNVTESPAKSPATVGLEPMENAATGGFSGGFAGFKGKGAESGKSAGVFEAPTSPAETKGNSHPSNPFESEAGFTTLFSKQADADKGLPFPGTQAPANPAEESKGVWGAMFAAPESPKETAEIAKEVDSLEPAPFERIGNLLNQGAKPTPPSDFGAFVPFSEPEAPESAPAPAASVTNPFADVPKGFGAPEAKQEPIPSGFAAFQAPAAPSEPAPSEPAPSEPAPSEPAPSEPAPSAGAAAFTPTAPEQSPTLNPPVGKSESIESVFSSFASGMNSSAPAAPAPQVEEAPTVEAVPVASPVPFSTPTPPVEEAPPVPFASRPSVEPQPFAPRPSSPAPTGESQGEGRFDLKDLELKAIFSTSEAFNLTKVARRVVDLPGILSCSLSIPGKLIQASHNEESRVGNDALEMISTLRNLAKLTGLPEARNFTLHTDRGIVSLFLEGECCVTVNHESATFLPGVREKLIIVARSLIHLEE